jgi:hypothetical protein
MTNNKPEPQPPVRPSPGWPPPPQGGVPYQHYPDTPIVPPNPDRKPGK